MLVAVVLEKKLNTHIEMSSKLCFLNSKLVKSDCAASRGIEDIFLLEGCNGDVRGRPVDFWLFSQTFHLAFSQFVFVSLIIICMMILKLNCYNTVKKMNISSISKLLKQRRLYYPASRASFDPPRKIGRRKETLLAASTIPIEHAPNSNVTEPFRASLSK